MFVCDIQTQFYTYWVVSAMNIGHKIKQRRKELKLTQVELAEKSSYKRRVRQTKAPHYRQMRRRRGALFYASISIVRPGLNSTVKWSAKTVIFSMSFFTRASSNSVMSVSCPAMKSYSSAMRFCVSSLLRVSASACDFCSRSVKISSAMPS